MERERGVLAKKTHEIKRKIEKSRCMCVRERYIDISKQWGLEREREEGKFEVYVRVRVCVCVREREREREREERERERERVRGEKVPFSLFFFLGWL